MKKLFLSKDCIILAVLTFIFISTGCSRRYYIASDFKKRTADHKIFAVLPFEMIFTGKKPDKLTDEDVARAGEAESKSFMVSYYDEILRSTKGGRKPIRVRIQHYDKTMSILEANDIDIRSSWKEDPGKLASLLGVDAVVKGRIEKHRFMSDIASYGIETGVRVLSSVTDNGLAGWVPRGIARSKEIRTSYSLLDTEGTTLWSIAGDMNADWRWPANEIIDHINRKSVKKFPYRGK